MQMELKPIGYVHSPYRERKDAPRQGRLSNVESEIVILDEYVEGLRDLDQCKQIFVLSWFDRSDRTVLTATPPHTGIEHGVFATRSPDRPNPIGLCVVDLLSVEGNILKVRCLDALDGTPVVDIKMYSPEIDCVKYLESPGNREEK